MVDLRLKFASDNAISGEITIVILLHIDERIVGVVVNTVSHVIKIDINEVKAPPPLGAWL